MNWYWILIPFTTGSILWSQWPASTHIPPWVGFVLVVVGVVNLIRLYVEGHDKFMALGRL